MSAWTGGGGGDQPNVDRIVQGEGGPKNSQICADILYVQQVHLIHFVTGETKFGITGKLLYVLAITFSTQDNVKLLLITPIKV